MEASNPKVLSLSSHIPTGFDSCRCKVIIWLIWERVVVRGVAGSGRSVGLEALKVTSATVRHPVAQGRAP